MKPTFITLLALCLCLPVAGADKEKPTIFDILLLKENAGKGDGKAQYELGMLYSQGKGVKQDYKEADKWLRKAAEQGLAEAKYNLGQVIYNQGFLAKDRAVQFRAEEAVKWFRKSAEQGFAKAQKRLGWIYATGIGAEENGREAEEVEAQRKAEKLSPKQAQEARLQAWFNSDWSELIEQQQERMEQAEMDREMELREGFWVG